MSILQSKAPVGAKHRFPKRPDKGFTMLELLVVVAIIGALAAIAIPVYNNYIGKAKVTVAVGTMDSIRKSLESFHIENSAYPQGIDFSTGLEVPGAKTVFTNLLTSQINDDILNPAYTYNAATFSYVVTANAKNKDQTPMIMTSEGLSY